MFYVFSITVRKGKSMSLFSILLPFANLSFSSPWLIPSVCRFSNCHQMDFSFEFFIFQYFIFELINALICCPGHLWFSFWCTKIWPKICNLYGINKRTLSYKDNCFSCYIVNTWKTRAKLVYHDTKLQSVISNTSLRWTD